MYFSYCSHRCGSHCRPSCLGAHNWSLLPQQTQKVSTAHVIFKKSQRVLIITMSITL